MKIPLVDLQKQYQTIQSSIDQAIFDVLNQADFVQGTQVRQFEQEFAAYLTKKNAPPLECASCGNGTDALFLALKALGISTGDEVLLPSHTFIATAEAISAVGAIPVFVEIDERTFLIHPDKMQQAITSRTRAIIAVHLYGQACDMDALSFFAQKHHLFLVEDCAQAHGATWRAQVVGSFGDISCFSFYPGKNLGAYGDAGAVVSKHPELITTVRRIANHGRVDKYAHLQTGINSRLDTLQAAILRIKLMHLDNWNKQRAQKAEFYSHALQKHGVLLPFIAPQAASVWHLYVIRVDQRGLILNFLKENGISAGVHYPIPLHLQPAYAHLGYGQGDFPITERVAASILSLPLYPELTEEEQCVVIGQIENALSAIVPYR